MLPRTRSSRLWLCALIAAAALTASCQEEPTAPPPSFASSRGGPKVTAADPDSTLQDTTLEVRVLGSGFDNGSRVRFALHGDTATPNIRTNSSRFVSSTELVANITVAANAVPTKYDVYVITSQGKPGIGTEMFTVEVRPIDLGTLGGLSSTAYSVNARGHVVGSAQTAAGATQGFFWGGVIGDAIDALPLPAGRAGSWAYGINDSDRVVGWAACPVGGSCQGDLPLLWERSSGVWTVSELPFEGSSAQAEDINNAGQVIGPLLSPSGGPVLWTIEGSSFTSERLPSLSGGCWAYAINDAGTAVGNCGALAALWYRDSAGWKVRDLGPLAGGTAARAYDVGEIDATGTVRVAGHSTVSGKQRAVRWTAQRIGDTQWSVTIQDLGAPKGNSGGYSARGVNTAGDAVGSRYWPASGASSVLPGYPRGSGQSGWGEDINDDGLAVGYAYKLEQDRARATLWMLR